MFYNKFIEVNSILYFYPSASSSGRPHSGKHCGQVYLHLLRMGCFSTCQQTSFLQITAQFVAVFDVELVENAGNVVFDTAFGKAQAFGNYFVR